MNEIVGEKEVHDDEPREEYEFDYGEAAPNRFYRGLVSEVNNGGSVVVLEPEVAAAFTTSKDVNEALQLLIKGKGSSSKS